MRYIALCGTLFIVASAFAQVGGSGSIQGTVMDSSQAAVVGANVIVTNDATGVQFTRETTAAGTFAIPLLPPGVYRLTVKAVGFQTFTQLHVIVNALQVVSVSPVLRIGSANDVITVSSEASMLQTDDVAIGSTIENAVYDALPLSMNKAARDPSAFVGLALGVENYSTQAAGPSTGSFSGGQPFQNETYVEGIPLTSAGTESDTRNLAFGVSVEAVEQFQVQTTGLKAVDEGQGLSNYVIRSGTNKFHGAAYEYLRNTMFDAKPYFSKVTPPEHQNEFGVSVGGPIKKDKVFFFANYDGYRFSSATLPALQTIPTAAERLGDFSAFPQPIYDPATTTCNGGLCTRQQFSYQGKLNVIDPARISKISQSLESYLPTNFANGSITNNYLATLPDRVTNDSGIAKVDINLSGKQKLSGLFSRGEYANPLTGSLTVGTTSTLPPPYTQARNVLEYATLAQAKHTYTINSHLINQVSFGMSRLWIPLTSLTASGDYMSKAGFTGYPAGVGFPDTNFGTANNPPISWDGTNAHTFNEAQTTFTAQENLLWSTGRHNFAFGFQWQTLQDNETFAPEGGFTFATNETANFKSNGTIDTATGNSYASFLLGAVDASAIPIFSVSETGGRYKDYAFWAQDDYQVNRRLTLNLGLRWDIWGPFTEVNDHMSFFNPTLANPLAGGRLGALEFAGSGADSCHCSTPVKRHNINPGPRIGLAYRLHEDTVLRGSFGITYAHAGGVGGRVNGRQGLSQLGFNSGGNLSQTVAGTPVYFWDAGYPGNPIQPPFFNPSYGMGFVQSSVAQASGDPWAGPGTAQTVAYGDPANGGKPPYYENWTLNVQHSFGRNSTLSIAYVGNQGHWLPGATIANQYVNQIPLKYLALGPLLSQTLVSSSGTVNTSLLTQAQAMFPEVAVPFPGFTGSLAQSLRPFPQYAGISNPWYDAGNSSYNGLQTSFNQRLSTGLTAMINYTWSKEADDLANVRIPLRNDFERSVGVIDHTHVITSTVLYQLPFGNGRRWKLNNSFLNGAFGGWQISGIYSFATGAPLTITGTCTGGGIIDAVCYPNYSPNFSGSVWQNTPIGSGGVDVSKTTYLNKAAFVDPAQFTAGNVARTAPYGLRVPYTQDVDLSVRREIAIREQMKLMVQVDAFNVSNEVHFAAPGTNIDNKSFGIFSSQANSPRKLQVGARFVF